MSEAIQSTSSRQIPVETKHLSYLENIVNKKVTNVALTCFETFVHWFLTTFSCFYPSYDRLYQAEVAKLSVVETTVLDEEEVSTPAPLAHQAAAVEKTANTTSMTSPPKTDIAPEEATRTLSPRIDSAALAQALGEAEDLSRPITIHEPTLAASLLPFPPGFAPLEIDESVDESTIAGLLAEADALSRPIAIPEPTLAASLLPPPPGFAKPDFGFDLPVADDDFRTVFDDLEEEVEEAAEAIAPAAVQLPKITRFQRSGMVEDFTAGKIAGLRVNTETYYADGEPYEFLTLNSYKVIRWGKPSEDINGHFDLMDSDKIIVKESVDHPGQIEIQEYNGYFKRIDSTLLVDPAKIYMRTWADSHGEIRREHVVVTDETNMTEPGYLRLINP